MTRKKIVFIIVEDPSDDEALALVFEKFFANDNVFVHITHGDITTQTEATKILTKIGNIVSKYAKSNHLTKKHFRQIIHIVDTDGAYIPDCAIIENTEVIKPLYSETSIHTANVVRIQTRNERKRKCLDVIASTKTVWSVPYQAYYMSSCLEHVLYNEINLSDEEKEKKSIEFARKYNHNLMGFIEFISTSDFSVGSDYLSSWSFIKIGLHSLERHTNLGICFT
ncbi:MAG: hypothetical protein IJS39_10975 [Synergistaceae bacterium]|nr:hypothetical protein [Synergistaceae bacterium]